MNAELIRRMVVIDFDGTLGRTPEKPKNWLGGWWGRKESLLPPHLPPVTKIKDEMPDFIDQKVLEHYNKAVLDPQALAVFMTGRHEGLKWIVLKLLEAFNIDPQGERKRAIFINGGAGGKTIRVKLEKIEGLLLEFPNINRIEIWEDRPEHQVIFKEFGRTLEGIETKVYVPPDWEEI